MDLVTLAPIECSRSGRLDTAVHGLTLYEKQSMDNSDQRYAYTLYIGNANTRGVPVVLELFTSY